MTLPIIQAVVGIVRRDNTILVSQRPSGKPYSGYWEFPGGKIEAREQGKEAVIRELHEELGIKVTLAKPWFTHSHTYPDKKVLLEIWLIEEFEGEPESKEQQALRWVTLEEMQTLHLLEGNWAILEKIKTSLMSSFP